MQRFQRVLLGCSRGFATKASQRNKRLPKPPQPTIPHRVRGGSHAKNRVLEHVDDGKTYRILCASVIERLPVVLPDLEKWEEDFMRVQHEIELKKAQVSLLLKP